MKTEVLKATLAKGNIATTEESVVDGDEPTAPVAVSMMKSSSMKICCKGTSVFFVNRSAAYAGYDVTTITFNKHICSVSHLSLSFDTSLSHCFLVACSLYCMDHTT